MIRIAERCVNGLLKDAKMNKRQRQRKTTSNRWAELDSLGLSMKPETIKRSFCMLQDITAGLEFMIQPPDFTIGYLSCHEISKHQEYAVRTTPTAAP